MDKEKPLPLAEEDFSELENRIQSLTDGELDAESRSDLLQSIDNGNPEYWRYLALGFVERQIIRSAIAEKSKIADNVLQIEQPKTKQHWTIAACLGLLLLAGAWWLGSQKNTTQESGITLAEESDVPGVLNIRSDSESEPFSMRVPIFDTTKDPESALLNIASSNRRIRATESLLRNRGFDTHTKTQFITAKLKDGRRLILPVNHIVFQASPN